MPDPNVNVIFHGLFLFVERKQSIDVLIPNMGPDHLYKAGTFLVEETLVALPIRTPYFLAGVTPGSVRFDRHQNIVFAKQSYNPMAPLEDAHARIVLPLPAEILSLRPIEDAYQADVDPGGLMDKKKTCGVQVLRYYAEDFKAVRLDRHTAKLGTHPPEDPKFLNLHIISEEDYDAKSTDHPRRGFDRTLHLIPGLRGTIHISSSTKLKPAEDDHQAQGFSFLETFDTRERMQFLVQVGLDFREGRPSVPPTEFVNEPPFDCVPLIANEEN